MSLEDMKNKIDQLGYAWRDFRDLNDRRLKNLENGQPDSSEMHETLNRINDVIDQCCEKVKHLELMANRSDILDVDCAEQSKGYLEICTESLADYMVNGAEAGSAIQNKEMNMTFNNGGYLLSDKILYTEDLDAEIPVIRKLSRVIKSTCASPQVISGGRVDTHWSATYKAPNKGVTADDGLSAINSISININTLYCRPRISKVLLNDQRYDVARWFVRRLADSFGDAEEKAFLLGNGDSEPPGILLSGNGFYNPDHNVVFTGAGNKITMDNVIDLAGSLPAEHNRSLSILSHKSTLQEVRKLKENTTNKYLWSFDVNINSESLYGIPIYTSQYMPQVSDTTKPVMICGNFKKGYTIVDNSDLTVWRDPYASPLYVSFPAAKSIGALQGTWEYFTFLQIGEKPKI